MNAEGVFTTSERDITAQALVAELRRSSMEGSEFAARVLKTLSSAGVRSADPSQWIGVRNLSSDLPIINPAKPVPVSPSALTSFDDCGLKWFLEKSGAQDGDSTAQLLGVAIHFIASQLFKRPDLTLEEGIAQLTEAWPVVDQNVGWVKTQQLQEATRMLTRFFEWHQKNPRTLIAVEEDFALQIGRAKLSGSVDRLEVDPNSGKYFVVDLKTGATVTQDAANEHKQLAAYQLGVVAGGFEGIPKGAEVDGAGLLFLKSKTGKNETVNQSAIVAEVVAADIQEAAEGMAAATFSAVINKRCGTCSIKALCPLQSEGRSVIE